MPSCPWYPHYPADYLVDTLTLTLEEDGLYRRLLDYYWLHGPIPVDLKEISKISRIDPRHLRRIFPVVVSYFCERDGYYFNKRMDEEIAQATDKSNKRRLAARARWDANASPNASPNADANAMPRACVPSSQPQPYKRKDKEGTPAKSAGCPSVWDLGETLLGNRNLLGKLLKTHGDEKVKAAILDTMAKQPAEPKSFLLACLKNGAGKPETREPRSAVERVEKANKLGRWAEEARPIIEGEVD